MLNKFNNDNEIYNTINKLTRIMNKSLDTATQNWVNINNIMNFNNKIGLLIKKEKVSGKFLKKIAVPIVKK